MSTMAEETRQLLQEAMDNGESLTAEAMVQAARDKRAYPQLNAHLWGPSEKQLAMEARINRATKLIISIKVTVEPGYTTRSIIHVKDNPGYYSKQVVEANPNLAEIHLQRVRDDIMRAILRYQAVATFLDPEITGPLGEALRAAWVSTFKPGRARPFPGDKEGDRPAA